MMALLDLIRRPKKKKAPALDFVPVIFANGSDDDLPGLTAAIENRRVQFQERIYKPDETIVIHRQVLALSCNFLLIIGHDEPDPSHRLRAGDAFIREARPSRRVDITHCNIIMGVRPQP